jgi:anti-sigma regulatory factor (Ser/Thr protein kinase)
MTRELTHNAPQGGYRHEALFYAGERDFVDQIGGFVRDGVAEREPTLVVLDGPKLNLVRAELGCDVASDVHFADMGDVGHNPGRIIDAWRQFVGSFAPGTSLRGVGEPLTDRRTGPERDECHTHEALLNPALAGSGMWLVCPYDEVSLPAGDLATATRTHPYMRRGGQGSRSSTYDEFKGWVLETLPEPSTDATDFVVDLRHLHVLRDIVGLHARRFGLDDVRVEEFVLAASEVASNSLLHGGGSGLGRCWVEHDRIVCEIADLGHIDDQLVGRIRPTVGQASGYGLWIANQVCDLVQIRSSDYGTTVRLHMTR